MKIKTLRNKIIIYFIFITIVPSIFLTFFYFKNTSEIYEENMLENAYDDLYYMKKSIDNKILLAKGFADWFYINSNFDEILTENYRSKNPKYNYNLIKIYDQIKLQLINSPISNYVSSVVIVGDNGVEFRYGNDASMIIIDEISATKWFQDGINQNGTIYWSGIIENPAKIRYSEYVLPIVRPIFHTKLYTKIGWVLITFKEELLSDIYTHSERVNSYKYFLLDQQGNVIPDNIGNNLLKEREINKRIYNILDQEKGYFHSEAKQEDTLYVYEKLNGNDWILVEMLSLLGLNQQKNILTKITLSILISSLIFTTLLTIFLSSNLTEPLKRLKRHVNKISSGNFEHNSQIEGQDEMGLLGFKINKMAYNIKELMNKIVEEEQEKRELELKALQNQINPHFLYNTLNSIKWMAAVQGADGIKNMVIALGRLLKNLNTTEEISLEEELSLLKEYIFIQQVRYKGKVKFNFEINDKELLKCKIIKFILQPIVENAIFHGVEAKKSSGNIEVFIEKDFANNDLIIKIKDDGIGMTDKQITELLYRVSDNQNKGKSRGIGLSNVNNRIKVSYGSDYGIDIKSKLGEYTIVIVKIPCHI